MSRRFQFSLGRLLASLSAVCVGAWLFAAGLADSDSNCSTSLAGAIFLDGLIGGGVIGLLVNERPIVGALQGICWAIALWVVVSALFIFLVS